MTLPEQLASDAVLMKGMGFDEMQHPRGQAMNAGQFRGKSPTVPGDELADKVTLPARLAASFETEEASVADNAHGGTPSSYRRSIVSGPLADRIRGRFPVAPDAQVLMIEETESWGTEWTQEISTAFEVRVGEWSQEFRPDNSEHVWADIDRPESIRDTVFARFDAWLTAGEKPEELLSEWFDADAVEECDWWVRYRARPGTILWRQARRKAPGRLGGVSLMKVPATARVDRMAKFVEGGRVEWQVDLLGETNEDNFTPVLRRIPLNWIGSTHDMREVMCALADQFMPGDSLL